MSASLMRILAFLLLLVLPLMAHASKTAAGKIHCSLCNEDVEPNRPCPKGTEYKKWIDKKKQKKALLTKLIQQQRLQQAAQKQRQQQQLAEKARQERAAAEAAAKQAQEQAKAAAEQIPPPADQSQNTVQKGELEQQMHYAVKPKQGKGKPKKTTGQEGQDRLVQIIILIVLIFAVMGGVFLWWNMMDS